MVEPIQINRITELATKMLTSFSDEQADHFIIAALDACVRLIKSNNDGYTNVQALKTIRTTIVEIIQAEEANGGG